MRPSGSRVPGTTRVCVTLSEAGSAPVVVMRWIDSIFWPRSFRRISYCRLEKFPVSLYESNWSSSSNTMRNGFSVRAKACRCQAVLPKKVRRSRICSRKLATLLSFATSAANSSTSPARSGPAASEEPGVTAAFTGFPAEDGVETELPGPATVDAEARSCLSPVNRPRAQYAPPAQTKTPAAITLSAPLVMLLCEPYPKHSVASGLPSYNTSTLRHPQVPSANFSVPNASRESFPDPRLLQRQPVAGHHTSIEEDSWHAFRRYRRRRIYWLQYCGRTGPQGAQRRGARRSLLRQGRKSCGIPQQDYLHQGQHHRH